MGEDAINTSALVGGLKEQKCKTKKLFLHGYDEEADISDPLHVYGSDRKKIILKGQLEDNESLSEKFYISKNLILWSIEEEMAIHLEDVLARRIRCLFLDAKETFKIAPKVAEIMAEALQKDEDWIENELKEFNTITQNYIL